MDYKMIPNIFKKRDKNPPVPSMAEMLYKSLKDGKRVLFVDDDEIMKILMMKMPEKFMVDLTIVSTASEAKDIVENGEGKPFDIAVLDYKIINGDGVHLYQWLKDRYPKLIVVFLTGYPTDMIEQKVRQVGSAPIYSKPLAMNTGFLEDMLSRFGIRRRSVEQPGFRISEHPQKSDGHAIGSPEFRAVHQT